MPQKDIFSKKENKLYKFNKLKSRKLDVAHVYDKLSRKTIEIKDKDYLLLIKEVSYRSDMIMLLFIYNSRIIMIDKLFFNITNELTQIN